MLLRMISPMWCSKHMCYQNIHINFSANVFPETDSRILKSFFIYTAICVPPSSLRNGYIYPYPNISSQVIIICTGSDRIYTSNCHPNGIWQPNPDNICDADEMSQGKFSIDYYYHGDPEC